MPASPLRSRTHAIRLPPLSKQLARSSTTSTSLPRFRRPQAPRGTALTASDFETEISKGLGITSTMSSFFASTHGICPVCGSRQCLLGRMGTSCHRNDPRQPVMTRLGHSFPKGNRFLVENVLEELHNPGDWYLDNRSGELTYLPRKGELLRRLRFEAPRLQHLVQIQGDPATHRYVENVSFSGLSFKYANWNLPQTGRFFPQAEVDLGAAIEAVGWRNGDFTDCTVSSVGEYGLQLGGGCQKVVVSGCEFTDLGAGGVKIGETKQYDNEADAAHGITVRNCLIAHGGRIHPAAIGVWIGQSAHNEVSHNDIYDLYYTGISVGWTWGYGKSEAHDNRIAYNHIRDIGQGVLSDMGGIYTLGVQPGTELIGNRIHDISSFSYGGWGIYPDEGSSHELIENNVVYRTKSGGYHQHYGQENIVRNNIIAFAREAEVIRTRAEDHLSFTFDHNIVYWKDAPLLGSNWTGNNYKLDDNIYWRTDGKPIDFAGMTLDQWHAKGQDLNSILADPLFEDPANGFFQLKPNSPALKLGFKPIDERQAGRLHTANVELDPPTPVPAFPLVKPLRDLPRVRPHQHFPHIPSARGSGRTVMESRRAPPS